MKKISLISKTQTIDTENNDLLYSVHVRHPGLGKSCIVFRFSRSAAEALAGAWAAEFDAEYSEKLKIQELEQRAKKRKEDLLMSLTKYPLGLQHMSRDNGLER